MLSLLPVLCWAESYPATHTVRGVAADDVLNIRPTPGTSGAPISALPPNAAGGVEVIRVTDDGRWGGLVNTGEGSGWVAMRFLARDGGVHDDFPLPARCFGTEPFWSLDLDASGTVTVTPMEGVPMLMATQTRLQALGRADRYSIVAGSTEGGVVHAVIARAVCSDDMSDREYGLTGDFLIRDDAGYQHWSGCCSLTN